MWLIVVNACSEWPEVISITTAKKSMGEQLDKWIQQYQDVITDKLGYCRKVKAKLYMKEDALHTYSQALNTYSQALHI